MLSDTARRLQLTGLAAVIFLSGPIAAQPKLDVPYGPTSFTTVDTMLRVAGVTARDVVIDLGSGDGRINIAAARDYGARGIGFDLDSELIQTSRAMARIAKVDDKVQFRQDNLFAADLSSATVVTLYLGPDVTPRVAPKLLSELRAGTRLVSHNSRLGDFPPDLIVNGRQHGSTVYFWWVPARVAGVWRGTMTASDGAPRSLVLDLRQRYQEIDGEATLPGAKTVFRDARLEGERLQFLLQEQRGEPFVQFTFHRFIGRVEGDTMTGHFRSENPPAETPFRMTRSVRVAPGPPGAWTSPPPDGKPR